MKNLMTIVAAIALLSGCSQPGGWTSEQQDTLRAEIEQNREKFVLQYMEPEDFSALQECVLESLTAIFPDYEEYDTLADRAATLDGLMSDCAVEAMGNQYENLAVVFPMKALQKAGWIAEGKSSVPEAMFYQRLAGLIRNSYPNAGAFVMALMLDPNAQADLRAMVDAAASR